jgi:xylose isomerase
MTLWMGNDGYDYSFQTDYDAQWSHTIAAMAEIADHDPGVDISIEYKPNEPRSFALMPDMATTSAGDQGHQPQEHGCDAGFCPCALCG